MRAIAPDQQAKRSGFRILTGFRKRRDPAALRDEADRADRVRVQIDGDAGRAVVAAPLAMAVGEDMETLHANPRHGVTSIFR